MTTHPIPHGTVWKLPPQPRRTFVTDRFGVVWAPDHGMPENILLWRAEGMTPMRWYSLLGTRGPIRQGAHPGERYVNGT